MVMARSTQESKQIVVSTQEERVALRSQQEVILLLKSLAEREETTVKLILDRLYELGALNITNNKLRSRILKRLVKRLAKLSQPAFRSIGFYWFKRNCPQLIANWLVEQVAFEAVANAAITPTIPANSVEASVIDDLQVLELRSKVRLLTRLLVVGTTIFGVSFAWLFYNFKVQPTSMLQPSQLSATCVKK